MATYCRMENIQEYIPGKRKVDAKDEPVSKKLRVESDGESGTIDNDDLDMSASLLNNLYAPIKTASSSDECSGNDKPVPEVAHEDYAVQDSPEDIKLSIEQKFLLEMPEDFFQFWNFCKTLNKEKPEEALARAGLTLVGPYDVLTGKLKNIKKRRVSTYVCHWRYYYDPPEFMTVIAGDEKEFHIGYFRDDPFYMPNFVASMSEDKPGVLEPLGENIFAGVCSYLTKRLKSENPFNLFNKTPLQRLQKQVESYALLKKLPLQLKTPAIIQRNKETVAKTFHGAGIVVPVDSNDVGYRCLPDSYATLKKILKSVVDATTEEARTKNFDELREIITNVQFASDEGDFGMGLELGINLLMYGGEEFHKAILNLLSVAYELLGRDPYIDIIQAHMSNRRKGSNMSNIDVDV